MGGTQQNSIVGIKSTFAQHVNGPNRCGAQNEANPKPEQTSAPLESPVSLVISRSWANVKKSEPAQERVSVSVSQPRQAGTYHPKQYSSDWTYAFEKIRHRTSNEQAERRDRDVASTSVNVGKTLAYRET